MLLRNLKLCVLLSLLLLCACGAKSPLGIAKTEEFRALPPRQALFVVPFRTVMVPPAVAEPLFDTFVDELHGRAAQLGRDAFEVLILKDDLESIDSAWLAARPYLTGEIFGYLEDSGARATDIRLKTRLQLHQPGAAEPTLVLDYPDGLYFEHDRASLDAKRLELAQRVAAALAAGLWGALMD
ncbi:hypothetical protein [Geoalkalibacter sp.]|uniref:hypothetical protein n=1 Tax=Geoalkalibacter sp. TaxID=3041440 RepID=UPI00272EB376|nr:hypothetical protein [Geoalkalibacter sp.]